MEKRQLQITVSSLTSGKSELLHGGRLNGVDTDACRGRTFTHTILSIYHRGLYHRLRLFRLITGSNGCVGRVGTLGKVGGESSSIRGYPGYPRPCGSRVLPVRTGGSFLSFLRDAQSIHVFVGGLAEDGQIRLTIADPQIAKGYYNKLHLASVIQSSVPSHSDKMLASLWHPQTRPGRAFPFFPVKGVQSWISS